MEPPIGIHCKLTPTRSMLDSTWFGTWKFVTQLKFPFAIQLPHIMVHYLTCFTNTPP